MTALVLPDMRQFMDQHALHAQRRGHEISDELRLRPDDPVSPEPASSNEGAAERPTDQTDGRQVDRGAERLSRQRFLSFGQGANEGSQGFTYSQCHGS